MLFDLSIYPKLVLDEIASKLNKTALFILPCQLLILKQLRKQIKLTCKELQKFLVNASVNFSNILIFLTII